MGTGSGSGIPSDWGIYGSIDEFNASSSFSILAAFKTATVSSFLFLPSSFLKRNSVFQLFLWVSLAADLDKLQIHGDVGRVCPGRESWNDTAVVSGIDEHLLVAHVQSQ